MHRMKLRPAAGGALKLPEANGHVMPGRWADLGSRCHPIYSNPQIDGKVGNLENMWNIL